MRKIAYTPFPVAACLRELRSSSATIVPSYNPLVHCLFKIASKSGDFSGSQEENFTKIPSVGLDMSTAAFKPHALAAQSQHFQEHNQESHKDDGRLW